MILELVKTVRVLINRKIYNDHFLLRRTKFISLFSLLKSIEMLSLGGGAFKLESIT